MANSPEIQSHENGSHKDLQIAVVMVPLPAQGHLNQLLHLSRLISTANIPVYYIGAAVHIRQAKLRLHGWNPTAANNMQFHEFPTPPFENPPPNPQSSIKFPSQMIPSLSATMNLRKPIYEFVNEISNKYRKIIVIYDSLMAYVVQDIGSVPNAEAYCFRSISAFAFYSLAWDAAGRPDLPAEAEILKEIPGPEGFFPPEFSGFRSLQYSSKKIFSGDIYNSSRLIEGTFLDLLEKGKTTGTDKVWAIGPFNPTLIPEKNNSRMIHKCLEWLEKQALNSVIFISFGTTSSLTDEQIQELAIGLERSHQKFIWVLRDADKGDIFKGEARKVELPEGFEERVLERGIVLRDWAPQLEILGHPSTGAFMSHCGWNSCMESISMGVPLVTWPMHSDQPRNAVLVTQILRIGVEVKDWSRRDEIVSSTTVKNAVRRIMGSGEGDEIRRRANELGDALKKSVNEGGISSKEMDSFIAHITR